MLQKYVTIYILILIIKNTRLYGFIIIPKIIRQQAQHILLNDMINILIMVNFLEEEVFALNFFFKKLQNVNKKQQHALFVKLK